MTFAAFACIYHKIHDHESYSYNWFKIFLNTKNEHYQSWSNTHRSRSDLKPAFD